MVLLLLGLAFVLATSSSLLATSGSGRGDNGDENSLLFPTCNNLGEVSGSASVTSSGELWLTVYIDEISILAKIEVVDGNNDSLRYKFTVVSIAIPTESQLVKESNEVPKGPLEVQFDSPDDAVSSLFAMFQKIGIEFSNASKQSINHAAHCGWRTPKECKEFIQNQVEKYKTT